MIRLLFVCVLCAGCVLDWSSPQDADGSAPGDSSPPDLLEADGAFDVGPEPDDSLPDDVIPADDAGRPDDLVDLETHEDAADPEDAGAPVFSDSVCAGPWAGSGADGSLTTYRFIEPRDGLCLFSTCGFSTGTVVLCPTTDWSLCTCGACSCECLSNTPGPEVNSWVSIDVSCVGGPCSWVFDVRCVDPDGCSGGP